MKISFRQGIVQYQQPTFLSVGVTTVDLLVTDTPTIVAFADGIKDYLYIEQETVVDAWGPILAATDQWLYWDIDRRTGTRTFGITFVEPVAQPIAPLSPANDQHWFDTSVNQMKVWSSSGNRWLDKIRAFACELSNGSVALSMSINSPDFDGTQVGDTSEVFAGQILFDANNGLPLKTPNGKFITTEDRMTTKTIATSDIKLAALVVSGEAQQNLAAYTIVTFSDFGRIVAADEFTSQQAGQFGIIQEGALVGDFTNVVVEGAITNPTWTWSTVNIPLYSDATGQLTEVEPIPNAVPVATVVDVDTIVIGVPAVTFTTITNPPPILATELVGEHGIVRLNIPADVPTDPIVVGANDPRLVLLDNLTGDVQAQLDSKVDLAGDTMTGFLTLNADPTDPLHAATKQYVDNAPFVALAGDTMTGFLTLNADPTDPLHAATKQYVDAAAGGISEPANQIVYGTGAGVDSDADFTWNPTTNVLTLGTDGYIVIDEHTSAAATPPAGTVALYAKADGRLYSKDDTGTETQLSGGGSGTPGGANTQIQYNDSGSFGGDADFTWTAATNVMTIGSIGTPGTISTPADTLTFSVAGDTASVAIDGNGGYITLYSNSGSVAGVIGETYSAGDGGQGGGVDIVGGRATGANDIGGTVFINGGFSELGNGGIVEIGGGTSNVAGGSGGDVTIIGGLAQGGGASTQGSVYIRTEGASSGETPGKIYLEPRTGGYVQQIGSPFVSDDVQTGMYVLRQETTNATQTEMFLDDGTNSLRLVLPDDTTWHFEIKVVARRTDANNESAAYKFEGAIDRNTGVATTATVGAVTPTVVAEDTPAWDVTVDADTTNGSLRIQVTGENAKTIRWVAFVRTVEVTG